MPNLLKAEATIKTKLTASATIIKGGVNGGTCPIILCIDGGVANTPSYPSVNGLLNSGTA